MLQIVDDTAIQGSTAWLEARKKFRNASETADVMGCGFNSPKRLKRIKAGLEEVFVNAAMRRGNDLEDKVRAYAEERFKTMFSPQVWENGKYRASLDGLSFDQKTLIEIKVSDITYNDIMDGEVPRKYMLQMQHQFYCCPAEKGWLVAYSPTLDAYASVEVEYNHDIFEQIQIAWDKFDKMEVPDAEYTVTEDVRYLELDERYAALKKMIDDYSTQLKEVKAEMELIADGQNIDAPFTKLNFTIKKGSVDYKKILKENGVKVDEELYRKPSTNYSSVRMKKR
jgi:putative phage-type endonuclease